MKTSGLFRFIVSYFKRQFKTVVLFCLFAFVFAAVFSLYRLPVEAVAYAVALCVCVGMVFTILDCWQYYKRHKLLSELLDRITLSIEELPAPKEIMEQDYQNLIATVHQDKIRLISQADNAKSDMVEYYTLWAHQIKTPIAAMRLLLQADETEQNAEISMELFKIEQYVEMVLQYLRIDSDFSDYILKPYSLDTIVKQAVRKYAKMFIRKKIRLDFIDLNCQVLTDEKWLVFVVEQILSNALKYTSKGEISIYMDSTDKKVLVIEDTGIGIQGEDLPRVCEKGFTGYNGRNDKKSTGIGLYLCKRILTKLSHTITIESEVGKGTKVKIGLDMLDLLVE